MRPTLGVLAIGVVGGWVWAGVAFAQADDTGPWGDDTGPWGDDTGPWGDDTGPWEPPPDPCAVRTSTEISRIDPLYRYLWTGFEDTEAVCSTSDEGGGVHRTSDWSSRMGFLLPPPGVGGYWSFGASISHNVTTAEDPNTPYYAREETWWDESMDSLRIETEAAVDQLESQSSTQDTHYVDQGTHGAANHEFTVHSESWMLDRNSAARADGGSVVVGRLTGGGLHAATLVKTHYRDADRDPLGRSMRTDETLVEVEDDHVESSLITAADGTDTNAERRDIETERWCEGESWYGPDPAPRLDGEPLLRCELRTPCIRDVVQTVESRSGIDPGRFASRTQQTRKQMDSDVHRPPPDGGGGGDGGEGGPPGDRDSTSHIEVKEVTHLEYEGGDWREQRKEHRWSTFERQHHWPAPDPTPGGNTERAEWSNSWRQETRFRDSWGNWMGGSLNHQSGVEHASETDSGARFTEVVGPKSTTWTAEIGTRDRVLTSDGDEGPIYERALSAIGYLSRAANDWPTADSGGADASATGFQHYRDGVRSAGWEIADYTTWYHHDFSAWPFVIWREYLTFETVCSVALNDATGVVTLLRRQEGRLEKADGTIYVAGSEEVSVIDQGHPSDPTITPLGDDPEVLALKLTDPRKCMMFDFEARSDPEQPVPVGDEWFLVGQCAHHVLDLVPPPIDPDPEDRWDFAVLNPYLAAHCPPPSSN
jgi:hypothetical protein